MGMETLNIQTFKLYGADRVPICNIELSSTGTTIFLKASELTGALGTAHGFQILNNQCNRADMQKINLLTLF